jgi:hypothetical protein
MKKLLGLFVIGAGLSIGAHAQKHSNDEVPAAVKTAFAQQFPGTNAKWKKTGDQYEARFKQNRQKMSAVFGADGTMSETERKLKVWELPLPVRDYVEQHYKGADIKEAARITRADGRTNYEAGLEDKEILFDAGCNFLKEEKI